MSWKKLTREGEGIDKEVVKAPMNGRITETKVSIGSYVHEGDTL